MSEVKRYVHKALIVIQTKQQITFAKTVRPNTPTLFFKILFIYPPNHKVYAVIHIYFFYYNLTKRKMQENL